MPTFNSIIPYVGDGVQTRWEANFPGGFIHPDHVFVVKTGDNTPAVFEGASTVVIEPAVPAGVEFTIERRTPAGVPLVDYSQGADFSEDNLDTTARQALFVSAEAADRMTTEGAELALSNAALQANSSGDRSRANHTGVQPLSSVAGLPEALQSRVLLAGTVSAAKTLTMSAGDRLYIAERGREGYFTATDADLSAQRAIDTKEAVFIPGPGGVTLVREGFDRGVWITWFGAKFDLSEVATVEEATDDTEAWNAAIAFVKQIGWGGLLLLPSGASKVTAPISILADNTIRIVGTAARKNYPAEPGSASYDAYEPGEPCSSLLVPVHAGEDAITVYVNIDGQGGAQFENFSIATLETGDVPKAGIGFDTRGHTGSTAPKFNYGATIRNVAIHGFKRSGNGEAVRVYNSDGTGTLPNGGIGAFKVLDCNFNFNNWAFRTSDNTIINQFNAIGNKLGKNSVGGISVLGGQNIAIRDNVMESTPNPIWVGGGGFFGAVIENNYFEANTGDQCIYVRERNGLRIGPNSYYGVTTTHRVMLVACQNGYCGDAYWASGCVKIEGIRGQLNNTVSTPYYRADDFNGKSWAEAPQVVSKRDVANSANLVREVHPGNGIVMPATAHDTTAGVSQVYNLGAATPGTTGQWLYASILVKRSSTLNADPVLRISTTGTVQSQDFLFNYVQSQFLPGEWMLLTGAIKLTGSNTGTTVTIFPYGTGAGTGLTSRVCHPYVAVVDDINKVRPFASPMLNRVESAAPGGTFVAEQGDILPTRGAGAAGVPGYYYVAATSSWKPMAAIGA